jgi:thymidylate synthase (FAD)
MLVNGPKIPILDHGYIRLIETYGSDEGIIEAARMSTNKGFLGWGTPETPGDEKLLRYLMENRHDTPLEMAGMIIEIQAPIMVFREWHRHRTQSYNEMSARYTPLPDVNYIPTPDRCLMVQPGQNKQAQGLTDGLTHDQVVAWLTHLEYAYETAQAVYAEGLAIGIPKELARLPVPVARYSRMRAHANLRNWLAFLTLRSDVALHGKKAQWEIRQYANALADPLIAEAFPRTYELFCQRAS